MTSVLKRPERILIKAVNSLHLISLSLELDLKLWYCQLIKPDHIRAHQELVAVEEDSRDVAKYEDEDDADEDECQVDLDEKHDNEQALKLRPYLHM